MRISNRFVAFATHLGISFLLFAALAAVIKFLWYPGVLFEIEGGWEGIKLIAGVDLVIGPALTLIVYNTQKPQLRRDLIVIGLLQALCITGGMGTVAYTRPIAVIYAAGTYYTATRLRFENAKIDIGTVPLLQQTKPVWINMALPSGSIEQSIQIVMLNLAGGLDIAIDRYEDYSNALKTLPHEGIDLEEAAKQGFEIPSDIRSNTKIRAYAFEARYGNFLVAVNSETGEPIRTLKK